MQLIVQIMINASFSTYILAVFSKVDSSILENYHDYNDKFNIMVEMI